MTDIKEPVYTEEELAAAEASLPEDEPEVDEADTESVEDTEPEEEETE